MRNVLRFILVSVAVIVLLSACKTSYVPIEKIVYRETVKRDTTHVRDSILVHDSITLVQRGDTVYKDKWHTETIYKYIYKNKVDSFCMVDSIPVPYPVEKELTKWEKFQLKYAVWSFGALCMAIVLAFIKLYRRFKK